MRIMLTGAGGFLGSRLFTYYREKYEVWAPSHKELDFTREESARKAVQDFHPDVLVHCGAISDVFPTWAHVRGIRSFPCG